MDIVCRTKTGIKSTITYDGLYHVDASGKVSLDIVSPLKPTVLGGNLKFVTGQVDPNILDINSSPQYLIKLWEENEASGYPLEEIAQSLYLFELAAYLRSRQFPSHTLLAEILVLLDGMNRCKGIAGFNQRMNRDKRKLLNIIGPRVKERYNLRKSLDVCELIWSMHNEYTTATHIHKTIPIEFTDDSSKPDFITIDNRILIDTKMRLVNDKPAYTETKDISISNMTIFSLLMRDGFVPLQRAFDEQNTDIAMVNLSLTSYGVLLSTGLVEDHGLSSAMAIALDIVKNNEKAVIFYTLPRGTINGIYSVCFKRSVIDEVGGDLSRTDGKFSRLGNKMNFSQFAEYVNGIEPEVLGTLKSGGLRIRGLNASDIPVTGVSKTEIF